MDDFLDLARNRRSIRDFTPGPVEFEKLIEVIRAGTYAPSVGNLQPWSFIVITENDLQEALIGECPQQGWMHNAPVLLVFVAHTEKVKDFYGEKGLPWCNSSCAAAVQNMLLACTDMGLGATWVTSFDADNVRDILKIPDGHAPHSILAFGYADEIPEPKTIKPLDQNVYFNAFGNRTEDMSAALRDWGEYLNKRKKVVKKVIDDRKPSMSFSEIKDKTVASLKDVVDRVKNNK